VKAVVVERPMRLTVVDVQPPVIAGDHDVLVRIRAAGICGSDLHIYDGTNAASTYPRVPGHETVGVVERTGRAVRSVAPGDRVVVEQVISCGRCYACRRGRSNVCYGLQVRGVHVDGGYQELLVVDDAACHLVPDTVSDVDAVMIEPLTIALHACMRVQVSDEDTMLLIGYGALGSTIFKVARLRTPRIVVADVSRDRLDEARRAGAALTVDLTSQDLLAACLDYTAGDGVTVAIDAACTQDSVMHALTAASHAGRVLVMGFSAVPTPISQFLISSKELDVRGSRLQHGRFPEAIGLVRDGAVDLTGAVSHTFPLADAQAAFDALLGRDPAVRKVALTGL
jgi:L-gulonate 5-dehydrogenase